LSVPSGPFAMRRKESEYAAQRKLVRLPELKLVDLVRTGDKLEFVYRGKKFEAAVTKEGFMKATTRMSETKRASPGEGEEGGPVYQRPSNFTLDCVESYWRDKNTTAEEACRTNPSGYERVRHVQLNKSLNELRDEYMQTFAASGQVKTPKDVSQDIAQRTLGRSKRKRQQGDGDGASLASSGEGSPARAGAGQEEKRLTVGEAASKAAKILTKEPITVATLRAENNVKGYKMIAERLEGVVGNLAQCVLTYETLLERVFSEHETRKGAVYEDVKRTVAVFQEQQRLASQYVVTSASSAPPSNFDFALHQALGSLPRPQRGQYAGDEDDDDYGEEGASASFAGSSSAQRKARRRKTLDEASGRGKRPPAGDLETLLSGSLQRK